MGVVPGDRRRKEVNENAQAMRMLFSFAALGLLSLVHAGPFLIPTYTTTTNSVTWYTYTSTSTMYNSCYQIAVVNTVATTDITQLPACSTYTTSTNPTGKKTPEALEPHERRDSRDKRRHLALKGCRISREETGSDAVPQRPSPPFRRNDQGR